MFSIAIDLVHDVRPGKLCSKLWNHESGLFEPPRNLLKLPIISLRYTLHTVSTVPLFNACPSNKVPTMHIYISQYMGSSTFQKGQVHLV